MQTPPSLVTLQSDFLVNIIKVIYLRNIRKSFAFSGVYIVWAGDCALYVGSSANVCKRAQRRKSDLKGRTEAFARRTHVDIYPCDSLRQALHLETELIGIYKPPYNKQGDWQSSRSIQKLKAEYSKFAEVA